MSNGSFPRIRKNSFSISGVFKIPDVQNGRLDLVIAEKYGTPTMYKVFAAANKIKNPMALRGTIRPYAESIRNELILKGYKGTDLEREYNKAINEVIVDTNDWLSYSDNINGVITEAKGGLRKYIIPGVDSIAEWYSKYYRIHEEDE